MRYQKFQPASALHPFVECFFIWEGEVRDRTDIQSPPSGFCGIVFSCADPHWAFQNSTELTRVPRAFASGQFTSNYHLVLKGKIGMAGIVLKPSALHNFFGLRMSTLVNNRMPLALLPDNNADQLWKEVKNGDSDEARVKVLESFITSYVTKGKKNLSVIDEAIDFIDTKKGCVSVEEVANHLRISRRYLEKGFLEKVGVSPKFYARIKRFGALSNIIAHHEKIDWQQIVFEYGFHDQSHLVKEFMEFNQMNPTDYHFLHSEMTRFLKR